ncbi:hypothetical protein QN277_017348 [Acacia crassicarpa]|uniref:Uncharacterized protein n=1 Tax=Acacia crassicarpa TaxID=499986 RepID=A0AAE1MQD6_9FABA|nr:hypothetical protein QN277_017348 [Acacia crassicarpa]
MSSATSTSRGVSKSQLIIFIVALDLLTCRGGFRGARSAPTLLKRLSELEEKVETLQSKPFEMPSEKEELLNAVVCWVYALEAELIATKKVGSLMRQEELLAYINRLEETKLQKFCW